MIRALAAVWAAGALAGSALPAQAQPVRTIEEAGSGTLKGDPDRVVCRRKTVTGSRLQKSRACRTSREWAELNAANVAAAKQLQRPGGYDGSGGVKGPVNLSQSRPR